MTTTELEPLIKAFVKTLEEATTTTHDLTGTQFESITLQCQRIVMDSLDIEPGTVVCVSAAGKQCVSLVMVTAMSWCGSDSTVVRTPTRSSLKLFVRLMMSCVSSTMGLSDEEHGC